MKIEGRWGGNPDPARRYTFENMPQHRGGRGNFPVGGNQVFADGSAQWVKIERMWFLHSWDIAGRQAYFYQDDSDFPAGLRSQLNNPNMRPQP
jgi:hypothetical protein